MLLNETRGSYGMYSREGRMTAETFHLLRKKEEILSGNPTKLLVKGNFNPDADEYTKVNEIIKEIKIIEDDEVIDIFAKNRKLIMSKEMNKINHKKKKIKEKLIGKLSLKQHQLRINMKLSILIIILFYQHVLDIILNLIIFGKDV